MPDINEKTAKEFKKINNGIIDLLMNTDIAYEISSAVSSASAASIPAAAYIPAITNNYLSGASDNKDGNSYSRIFDEFFDRFNKPIQVTLDGKVVGESVLNYSENKKRSTGT